VLAGLLRLAAGCRPPGYSLLERLAS
jgi:hypothetical protein